METERNGPAGFTLTPRTGGGDLLDPRSTVEQSDTRREGDGHNLTGGGKQGGYGRRKRDHSTLH
jgi:hypothetical protein